MSTLQALAGLVVHAFSCSKRCAVFQFLHAMRSMPVHTLPSPAHTFCTQVDDILATSPPEARPGPAGAGTSAAAPAAGSAAPTYAYGGPAFTAAPASSAGAGLLGQAGLGGTASAGLLLHDFGGVQGDAAGGGVGQGPAAGGGGGMGGVEDYSFLSMLAAQQQHPQHAQQQQAQHPQQMRQW